MKKFVIVFIITQFVSLLCLGQDVEITPAPKDKAVVYFIRAQFGPGPLTSYTIFDSTRFISHFFLAKYIRYECNPGKHLFWLKTKYRYYFLISTYNRYFLEAEVEAGKIYFLEVASRLEAIDPNDEKKFNYLVNNVDLRVAKPYTPDQLEKKNSKYRNFVEKSLNKYSINKARGHTFEQLERTMFYRGL